MCFARCQTSNSGICSVLVHKLQVIVPHGYKNVFKFNCMVDQYCFMRPSYVVIVMIGRDTHTSTF